jgi:hypothetical protein
MLGVAVTAYEAWCMFLSMSPINLNSFDVTSLSNLNVEVINLHWQFKIQIDSYHLQLNMRNDYFGEVPSCSFC